MGENKKRSYKVDGQVLDVPESEVSQFLKDVPDAVEVKSYIVDNDTLDIPINEVDDFIKNVPDAKPLFIEEEPKKKSTETTPAAKEAGAGSFKLSPEFVTADSPYAAFQSELKTKAQELGAAMNKKEITFNVTPEQNKSFVKAMANMPDALVDSEDAKLSFVANFSKKTGASKKNLISLWNQTKNNKRRLEALESEYLMAPELVFQDVPGVGAGVVLSGRQVKLESPVAGGVMGSYAGVVQGAEQPAPPDVSVQQKAPKTFEQESMDLYELASLYNYFGDHEKAKEAFYLLEGKLKQQAEQELQDKDFAARAPKNYIEQRQAPATQGLAYTAYVSGDRAESKRITDILESKGLLEKQPELSAVGAGDVLQPSYTAPKYGFTGKQGFEYTSEEGVRPASRPTPESEYLNQIQEGIVQTSTIGPMAQMAEHGVEKLGEGLKEISAPFFSPYGLYTPKGYIKSTIKLVTGLAESVAGIAGMTTPQGAMAAIPFMQATTTMMPPEVAEWAMPTSKLVRNYYTDKGLPVPEWAENLAVLGDFALLGLLHKAGEGGAKRYKARQETKRQAATLDEFFAEGIRPEEMERISKVVEKRWEDAGKDPVIYAEQVAERVNKEVKPELESMEAEVTEVPPYNPPPAPESLRTLTEGADVEMNGEVGNIERGDDGSWYFVNDKGESKQIPVADKFNPTEKLSELGIQVLPEISKADIARAAADAEMTGFVEYNGRRYFVSLDSTGKVNPVGDRVFEVRADGTMVDRFSSHPDPKFAADRMLAITNAFRESKGMPKRTKNITPWKESERYEVEGGTIAFEPETINAMGGKGQYLFYDPAGNPRVITEAEYARLRDGGKAIKVDGQYQPGYEGYEQGAGVMPEAKVEMEAEVVSEPKEIEQQVEEFGVSKEMAKPVTTVIGRLFDNLKKAAITTAQTLGEWIGIGKGEEKPYALKINGRDVMVKNVGVDVVNGFYSPIEKRLAETKIEKQSANKWLSVIGKGDEAEYTGVRKWLESKNPQEQVSKAEIQQWMKDNRISVVEVVKEGGKTYFVEDYENFPKEVADIFEKYVDDTGAIANELRELGYSVEMTPDFDIRSFSKEGSTTKHSPYQLEGEKENYKEVLVTLPRVGEKEFIIKNKNSKYPEYTTKTREEAEAYINSRKAYKPSDYEIIEKKGFGKEEQQFKSSHFDEPNILVHLRMNTRTDAEGNKVVFLEEVQSDWGQKGKKEGFKKEVKPSDIEILSDEPTYYDDEKRSMRNQVRMRIKGFPEIDNGAYFPAKETLEQAKERWAKSYSEVMGIPTAPFVTETNAWVKLGLKFALREAIKQGADKIAWSTGTQQFDRWGSEEIKWEKNKDEVKIENGKIIVNGKETGTIKKSKFEGDYIVEDNETGERYVVKSEDEILNKGRGFSLLINEQTTGATAFDGQVIGNRDILSIQTKEELRAAINKNLKRERNDAEIDKLTDRIWNRMQTEDSGASLPRKEGMEEFYGNPKDMERAKNFTIKKEGELFAVKDEKGKTIRTFKQENEANKFKENYGLGIVGNVAKSLTKQEVGTVEIEISDSKVDLDTPPSISKSGDGRIGVSSPFEGESKVFDAEQKQEALAYLREQKLKYDAEIAKRKTSTQHSIDITPELKAEVEGGMPLFRGSQAQYRIQSGKNLIEAIKDFDGSPEATVAITHEVMHPTVVEIFNGAKEGVDAGVKHANTIVKEYNKATDSSLTVEDLIRDNDAFKEGTTSEQYRAVQEFIAEAWERYHTEGGKGFSAEFQQVLQQITEAFRVVYKSLTGQELTPELRQMFDELLGREFTEAEAPKVEVEAPKVEMEAPKVEVEAPKVEVEAEAPAPELEGSELVSMDYSVRNPKKNTIVFVDADAVLERHSKDQPAYDITKPENQIKGRLQKAKEFLLNYIKDQRSINPKTGERTKFNVKFEPSVASIENGKLGFEDGRHRILAAKELGLKTVAIEVPKDQAAMFKKEFAAKKPSEGGVPKAQDPRIQAKNDLLGLVDRYNTLPKRDRGTVGANLRGRIQKEATSLGLSLSANKSGRLILLDKSGRSVRKTAIKLSEEARALRKEQIDSYNNARQMPAMDVRHAIIQFFMGGGKINEAALDSTIGGSLKKDIPRGLVGKKGYAIDMLYEMLSQADPEIMFQIDEIDFVGSVGDVLMEFSNRGQMKDALLEYYSKSKDVTEFGSKAEYEAWLDYKEEMFREAAELGVNLEEVSVDSWRSAIEQERMMSDDAVNEFLADLDKNAPKTTEEINRLYEEHGVPEKEVSDISSAIQRETEAEFARIREEDATKQRAASEVERAESLREAEAELTAAEKNLQSERARVDKLRKESAQESMFPKPKEDVLFDERITLAGRQAELKAAENRVAVAKRRVEELRSAAPSEIAPEGSPLRNAIDELRKAKENFDRGIEGAGFAYDPKKRAQDLYDLHKAYVKVAKEAIKEGVRTIEEFARVVSATTKGAVMAFEEAMGRKAKLTLQDFEKAKLSKDYNEPYVFKGKTTKGAIKAAAEMPIAQDLKDLNVKMKAMAKAAIEGYKQGKREIREMWAAKNAQNRAFADQVNAQMQKLRGRIGSKTAQAIVKKALVANTPARMRAFERFAGRAIMNANYVAQVEAASSVRSRLKKLVSGKDAAKKLGANNVAIIKALAKIRPEDILDFDQYFDIAERVIESNQSMRYDKVEGGTTKARPRITNEEVANYLVEQDKFYENQLKQEVIAQHQDLIDMGIIDPDILSADDMLAIVESIENTEVPLTEELLAEMFDRQIAEVAARQGLDILSPDAGPDFDFAARENKRLTLQEKVLKAFQDTVKYAQMDLETYLVNEAADLTPRQREAIGSLLDIDTALLSKDEAVMVNRAIQNIIYNNSFAGVDQVAGVISFNQKAVSKAGKITKNKPVREVGKITRIARSKDLALEKVFGNIDQAIEIKKASGIERLWNTVAEMKNRFSDYYDSTKNKTSFISMREALSKRDKRDYNDTRNRAIRGMYAKMIKNFGGSEIEIAKEFVRHKRQVLENIKAYLSAGGKVEIDAGGYIKADENNRPIFTETTAKLGAKSKALREEGELLLSIYNELFKDANNAAELRERIFNEGRGNVELVERAIEINRENRNAVFESAEMDQNKIDLDYQENYTRDKYKSITDTPIETADSVENLFNTVFSPRNVKDKASGSMNKVVRSDKSYVNQGRVLNFDFDNVFRDALYDDMFASATSKNINQLRQLFRNKESATVVFGSDTNAAYFKRMLMRSIDIMRNRRAPATDLQRSVVGTIGKISYDATRLALLGTSQIFKQFMGVAVGSMISNGAVQAPRMLNYFARGFRHMNHPMLNEFNISQRGTILGGFFSEATDVISERGLIKKNVLAKVLDLRKSIGDTIAKPLGAGDAGVARASWWMYYLDYLYKKGVDVNAIDFETIRPDYDAAAYAEQMVSRMQNANDRASMPELYASGDPFLKIMRDFALPFSSFSVNMNRRMANDIDILYNGTSSQKLQAYRSLQSAVVEQFVFNSMKVYLLGSATQAGADLLSDYFEISDDELEKVYKSAYGDTRKTKTEKVIWNSIEDIFMGALPAPVKSGIKEYVNKSYVALTGVDEEWQNGPFYVYRTTDDPDFPSWIDYTGVYGMYGKTIYDVGKMGEMAITGEYEAAEGAKVEMSDNEQRAVMASALIDFAALAGVSDQDVSSINTKLKRQIKKHLGREYGKDIQITVPKKAATIADPFRDVDREVSAERFVRFWNDPETTEQERYNVIKQGVINKRTWTEKAGEGRVSFMDALKKLDRKAYIKVKLLKKKAEREVKLGQ
jgi:hypothetical protein